MGNIEEQLENLERIRKECGQPDWDGYHACAVPNSAVYLARVILLGLPCDLADGVWAVPSCNGNINLDWGSHQGEKVYLCLDVLGGPKAESLEGSMLEVLGWADGMPTSIDQKLSWAGHGTLDEAFAWYRKAREEHNGRGAGNAANPKADESPAQG